MEHTTSLPTSAFSHVGNTTELLQTGTTIRTKTRQHGWSAPMVLNEITHVIPYHDTQVIFYTYLIDNEQHEGCSTLDEIYILAN